MKQIVCLSATPWRKRGGRTQRLLAAFPDCSILYFEPGAAGAPRFCGEEAAEGVFLYTLPQVPTMTEAHPRLSPGQHRRLLRTILDAMEENDMEQPLFWVCSPFYDELLEELPRCGLLYDCDQDWSALPTELESRLACRADLVFAASPGLQERLSPCNENVLLLPNGIDFARFDALRTDSLPCPADMELLRAPILGYVGTVWASLNLAPLRAAALAHPEWSFVLLGRVSRKNPWLGELYSLPNVYFLGEKRQEALPAYLRHMQLGLGFLRDGMEDNDILSPRIFEYFAQGLPVVAMYHHLQREVYPTLIESAYTPPRFVEMCEKLLQADPTEKKVARYQVAQQADWRSRGATLRAAVESCHLLEELDLRRAPDSAETWF